MDSTDVGQSTIDNDQSTDRVRVVYSSVKQSIVMSEFGT